MNKRELIDEIVVLNHTAQPCFLARFDEEALGEYLSHLHAARKPRLTGDASRYERYFVDVPVISAAAAEQTIASAEREALIGQAMTYESQADERDDADVAAPVLDDCDAQADAEPEDVGSDVAADEYEGDDAADSSDAENLNHDTPVAVPVAVLPAVPVSEETEIPEPSPIAPVERSFLFKADAPAAASADDGAARRAEPAAPARAASWKEDRQPAQRDEGESWLF